MVSSDLTATGGGVTVKADNTSAIRSIISSDAAAIGGGIGGVGAAIGVSVAYNFVGYGLSFVENDDGVEVGSNVLGEALTAAFIEDSDITASGAITVDADSTLTIEAIVKAFSVGIGAGGFGFGGAGAGSVVTNLIAGKTLARIDGSRNTGVDTDSVDDASGSSVSITATDNSSITAVAGAAAISAAFGGGAATVSIAVSTALNQIETVVEACLVDMDSVTATAGDVVVAATESATISATAAAAGMSASFSSSFSAAISGAGADAVNVILTDVDAKIENSTVNASGDVSVTAVHTASIDALIISAAVSAAASPSAGISLSIGSGTARNFIGYNILGLEQSGKGAADATITGSSITAGNDVSVLTDVDNSIVADVVTGSVALAGGAFAGAIAGAFAGSVNLIGFDTTAEITSGSALIARDVKVQAEDDSTITSHVAAASIAATVGAVGASIALGGAVATNSIDNRVTARITGTPINASRDVTVNALEDATTTALAAASTIAANISLGPTLSAGSAEATNLNTTTTDAYIDAGANSVDIGDDLTVLSQNQATTSTTTGSLTVAAGLFSFAANGSIAISTVTPTAKARVIGSDITVGDDASVRAVATPEAEAIAYGVDGGALSVGVSAATALTSPTVESYISGNLIVIGDLDVDADLTLNGTSPAAKTLASASSGALIGVNGAVTVSTTSGTVKSFVADNSILDVGNAINITASSATDQNAASDSTVIAALAGIGANVVTSTSDVTTEAYLGSNVQILNGADVGGLVDGQVYYVVLHDTSDILAYSTGSDTITLDATLDIRDDDVLTYFNGSQGADITGLEDGVTYKVDKIGANTYKLFKQNADGTFQSTAANISGSIGVSGHSIRLLEPRQVGLVSTLQAATETANPTLIPLTALTVGGLMHTLTPTSAFAAGAFNFDPKLDVANNRINLSNGLDIPTDYTSSQSTTLSLGETVEVLSGHTAGGTVGSIYEYRLDGPTFLNLSTQDFSDITTWRRVPTDLNLIDGSPVVYNRSGGADLTIAATGNDTNLGRANALGVSVGFSGAASQVDINDTSTTKAYIKDYTVDAVRDIRVNSLTIDSTHVSNFDGSTDSTNVALVGGSGSWLTSIIDADVEANIGAGVSIQTSDLNINANNVAVKDLLAPGDYNVAASSGGVVAGNAGESEHFLYYDTSATIGNNAIIDVVGSVFDPGEFFIDVFNEFEGSDDVNLNAGGLLSGAGATSNINVRQADSTARIGSGATINTVGDIDIQTRTRANLIVEPQVNTYGLAAGAAVDAKIELDIENRTEVGQNATLVAAGDVNLLSGKTRDGAVNSLILTAHGDALNASAVPIDDLEAEVDLDINNQVVVESSSNPGIDLVNDPAGTIYTGINAGGDVNLVAETLDQGDKLAYGTGKNWLTAVASGIDTLFGSDGVAEEIANGDLFKTVNTSVTMDGFVQTGLFREQTLVFEKNLAPTSETDLILNTVNTAGIGYTITYETLAANLFEQKQRLEELIREYQGDTESVAAYTADLERIERTLDDLGLSADDGFGTTFYTELTYPVINLDDIFAQTGSIRIEGSSLSGSGTFYSPGDVEVSITNETPALLRLGRIEVPENNGGRVLLNNADLTPGEFSNGTIVTAAQTEALVDIVNSFNVDDPLPPGLPTEVREAYERFVVSPNIEITGEINNIDGTVRMRSEGSIIAFASINASRLDILAKQDFVLNALGSTIHTGGDPSGGASRFATVASLAEGNFATTGTTQFSEQSVDQVGGVSFYFPGVGWFPIVDGSGIPPTTAQLNAALADTSKVGNLIAGNIVQITASRLNVNGVIQSGIADQEVIITSAVQTQINAAEAAVALGSTETLVELDLGVAELEDLSEALGLETENTIPGYLEDSKKVINAFYNVIDNRIEISSSRVKGGFLSLTGQVLSTGNGELRALDGYGRIKVQNDLNVPILIDTLDVGNDIAGVIKITDFGPDSFTNEIWTTTYERIGTDIQKTVTLFESPGQGTFDPATDISGQNITLQGIDLGYEVGDKVIYQTNDDSNPITGLSNNGEYYVVFKSESGSDPFSDTTTIRLSASAGGSAINLTFNSSSTAAADLTELRGSGFSADVGNRSTTYDPRSDDFRFNWTTGQNLSETTTTRYGTSDWLGIDSFAPDPDDIVSGPTRVAGDVRKLEDGAYFEHQPDSTEYLFEFERIADNFEFDAANVVGGTTDEIVLNGIDLGLQNNDQVRYVRNGGTVISTQMNNATEIRINGTPVEDMTNLVTRVKLKFTNDTTTTKSFSAVTDLTPSSGTELQGLNKYVYKIEDDGSTTTWYGTTTNYALETEVELKKNIFTHSIKADKTISINFIGYDEGADDQSYLGQDLVASPPAASAGPLVAIRSVGDVLLGGSIGNEAGYTQIVSTLGEVIQLGSGVVTGKSIEIRAATGIGAQNTVLIDQTQKNLGLDPNGIVNLVTGSGDIQVRETSGDLRFDQITSALGSTTEVSAERGIYGVDGGNLIQGSRIFLTGESGGIGDYDGDQAVRINSSDAADDFVNIAATDDVNITENLRRPAP